MRDLKLFEEYWGNLIFSFCFGKIDVLPRVTLSQLTESFIINIGILFFTLNLTI